MIDLNNLKMINLKKNYKLSTFFDLMEIALIVFALSWFLKTYFIQFAVINSNSMMPTLLENDRVGVLKNTALERGDLVICLSEENSVNVRRIIGLPGERVEVRDGHTYINSKPIYEPYIAEKNVELRIGPLDVAENEYFLLQDNRKLANAENIMIPLKEIKGEPVFIYWPLTRVNIL